nr:hypothetical protein [Tanacetum cinerariifolium]
PDEVHPQLPSPNQTIHGMHSGKIGVYTRQSVEDEPRLLEITIGRVVLLLLVAPARASNELEASVDKLFDEGSSGDGQGTDIQPVIATTDTIVEELALLQPRRQRKRKSVVVMLADLRILLKTRGEPIPTLPFVTSSVSATLEREDKSHVDSVTGLNLRTIDAPQRFVIFSYSSHHSGANIAKAEVDSIVRSSAPAIATVTTVTAAVDAVTTADRVPVEPSLFGVGLSSTNRTDSVLGGFSNVSGSDFLIGGIRTIVEPDSDIKKVYVLQWSVTNGFGLDDNRICHEMLDEFAPLKFFASVDGMDHDQLFTEFNVGAVRQISLSAEVRMCAEYNIIEKKRLRYVVDEQAELLKVRDGEIKNFKAQLLLKEAEATEAIRLRAERERERNELSVKVTDLSASVKVKEHEVTDLDAQVITVKLQNDNLVDRKVAAYKDFIGQLEKFQDEKIEEVNEKFDKLCANFVDMALHLEEKFYPHLLTTIFGRRWLLAYGMKLAIVRFLNSAEYMYALGAAVSKAVQKGMQEELSAGITHGAKDKNRPTKIRENIASHVSALRGIFVPLFEPLSATALEGMKAEDAQVAGDKQVKGRQAEIYQIDIDHASKVLSSQEDKLEVQEVVEVVTTAKLITEVVVVVVSESVSAASVTIAAVPAANITAAPVRVATASTRRRKEVVIRDPEEESTTKKPAETKSKDKGKGIMVEEPKPMKKKQQVEMDKAYARKLHEELN